MRRVAGGIAAVFVAMSLAGCAPEPAPAPSGFPDEDAAFAAAEATYRAYVDALNRVDLSDPETFEDVYRWTTGEHNAADRKTLSMYHAESYSVSGRTKTQSFTGTTYSGGDAPTVEAIACSDVSEVQLLDQVGRPVSGGSRPDTYQLRLEFVVDRAADYGLKLDDSTAVENTQCG